MLRVPFPASWTVGPKLGAFERPDAATAPRPVTLPHDALRDLPRDPASPQGVHAGYIPGGVFAYTATFEAPAAWRDKTVLVEFEGVYRDAVVRVNGDVAAHHAGGYSAFAVPLDGFLRFGETNTLTVDARVHKDSRWYTGAGVYRPVHLIVADPVHLTLDGIDAPAVDVDDERAMLALSAEVRNATRHTRTTRVTWAIVDPGGVEVARTSVPLTLTPGETAVARTRVAVADPQRWSPETPHLYRVEATLAEEADGRELDRAALTTGIRTLQLDPAHGLRINGARVDLRGACVHHDNGVLGSAGDAAAEDRRIRRLKDAGFNAIRSSHNPASRAVLEACDRHGMLVMDELTDVWLQSKTAFDASITFAETWREEVAALVAKDRSHPSVILYSIGNEILELGRPIGAAWGRRLAEEIRRLDPTRYVTNGINGIIANLDAIAEIAGDEAEGEGTNAGDDATDPNTMMANMGAQMAAANASDVVSRSIEEAASVLDVVGFNYADSRYRQDAIDHPHRVIVGSETFPDRIAELWRLVTELPHVIGDFTWTGWDYLGEAGIGRVDYTDADGYVATGTAGPYPYVLADCGDIDITGYRLPASYYREIAFGLRRAPYIAVHRPEHHGRPTAKTPWSWDDVVASWSWGVPAGAPVTVDVYADADEVELLLEGRSLGVAPVGEVRDLVARFEIAYRPGELLAVARKDGAVIGSHALSSAGEGVSLRADVETGILPGPLSFVDVVLVDAAGVVSCDRDVLVTVEVDGPGEIAGLGTGRARTEESFAGPSCTTFDGRALAVIRRTGDGPLALRVSAEDHAPTEVALP
ncbi:glycoside hydrolase family 2 TIM barrel-domain containing protein [Microbacterium sp. NPDC077184]|uniref:glycoside hydrolase family 2 TIM barrel-domain containing protein n=1 Tax=Microbacterium sp. NPDC077184 TaxID=3154764 RepID=UPI0034482EC0